MNRALNDRSGAAQYRITFYRARFLGFGKPLVFTTSAKSSLDDCMYELLVRFIESTGGMYSPRWGDAMTLSTTCGAISAPLPVMESAELLRSVDLARVRLKTKPLRDKCLWLISEPGGFGRMHQMEVSQ